MELAPTLLGVYKTIKVKVRNQIAQIAVIGILCYPLSPHFRISMILKKFFFIVEIFWIRFFQLHPFQKTTLSACDYLSLSLFTYVIFFTNDVICSLYKTTFAYIKLKFNLHYSNTTSLLHFINLPEIDHYMCSPKGIYQWLDMCKQVKTGHYEHVLFY